MEEEVKGCGHSCEGCTACGHEHDLEDEGILTFVDEEGNDVRFEVLDVVAMNDKEYLVVLPLDEAQDEEQGNVLILEIKQEDGEEVYDTVVDDEEAEKVFAKFQEQNDLVEESGDEE